MKYQNEKTRRITSRWRASRIYLQINNAEAVGPEYRRCWRPALWTKRRTCRVALSYLEQQINSTATPLNDGGTFEYGSSVPPTTTLKDCCASHGTARRQISRANASPLLVARGHRAAA